MIQQVVAELVVEPRTHLLVTRREAKGLNQLRSKLADKAKRPLYGDLPIAEGLVRKNPGLLGRLELKVRLANAVYVAFGQLAILLAQILAQWLEPLGCVNELNFAFAVFGFLVGQNPNVSSDTGI